jgi:hypothetical protein
MRLSPLTLFAFICPLFLTLSCSPGTSPDTLQETVLDQVAADDALLPSDAGADALALVPVAPHVEEMGHFTVVWLSGTAYEMGYQHGELLYDTIAEAITFVENDLTLSAIPIIAEGMGLIDLAEANSYPDIIDECQGMVDAAAGTGLTMDLCLVLNFGDVLLEMITHGIPGPGCSSLIARGEATPDGLLRHARNLDWGSMDIAIIHQHPVIFVRQPSGGIPHVYIGFPMNLSPYSGMNLAGIAMGSHEIEPAGPSEQAATGRSHVQMLGQALKQASSLDDVRAYVHSQEHMSAELFSVSDGDGQTGAIFEMTASAVAERSFQDGLLYATNHFLDASMQTKHAPPSAGSTNRIIRFEQLAAKEGAESHWGQLDEGTMATIMRDPISPETGVAESDDELAAKNWDNDGSLGANGPMHFVIFDPAQRLFYVDAGVLPLHKQPYHCFSLEELLNLPDATPCPAATLP